jgi:hydroxyacylglutathione hydrolase
LTGVKIIVHEKDAGMLRTGTQGPLVPTGFVGRIAKFFIGAVNRAGYPGADPDIVIIGTFDLALFGVAGTIVPTPGHTAGSVSIVLESGDVCRGSHLPADPLRKARHSVWAEKPSDVYTSVKALLTYHPRIFHLGHGGPFTAEAVEQMVVYTGNNTPTP